MVDMFLFLVGFFAVSAVFVFVMGMFFKMCSMILDIFLD